MSAISETNLVHELDGDDEQLVGLTFRHRNGGIYVISGAGFGWVWYHPIGSTAPAEILTGTRRLVAKVATQWFGPTGCTPGHPRARDVTLPDKLRHTVIGTCVCGGRAYPPISRRNPVSLPLSEEAFRDYVS